MRVIKESETSTLILKDMADKYEMKDDTATLFVNQEKAGENHPDYTGKIKVGGKVRRLAGWKKQAKSGTSYLSLAISDFQEQKSPAQQQDEAELDAPF